MRQQKPARALPNEYVCVNPSSMPCQAKWPPPFDHLEHDGHRAGKHRHSSSPWHHASHVPRHRVMTQTGATHHFRFGCWRWPTSHRERSFPLAFQEPGQGVRTGARRRQPPRRTRRITPAPTTHTKAAPARYTCASRGGILYSRMPTSRSAPERAHHQPPLRHLRPAYERASASPAAHPSGRK